MIEWNPLVNTRFSLDGEFSLKTGYLKTMQFDSGKESRWLANSFVPREFPSLKLALNNRISTKSGKTEFEEFNEWYNISLRYGSLVFQMTRIGYKQEKNIKIPEIGVYKFIINSLNYDKLDGIVMANFGLEEISITPETRYGLLGTHDGKILLMGKGIKIMVIGV